MYMIGILPFQGYGFLHVVLAQAVHLIHILPEHTKTTYMNGSCDHDVHSTRNLFALNMVVYYNGGIFNVSTLRTL